MKINTISTLAIGLLSFGTPFVMAEDGHNHQHKESSHEAHADHMLEGYAVVSEALYKDDLATAKKAAAGMVKHDKKSSMATAAKAISKSKSITEARKHFNDLSEAAIPVAKKEKSMYVAHCPMAMNGKGANWLQSSNKEINNPYMGAKMPHCGKFVK